MPARKTVLASGNPGKLRELGDVLRPLGFSLVAQTTLGVPDAEETGVTFVENALIKARNASARTQLPAIADDSGLVVPALGGQPGIRSARYAHEGATDRENNEKLIAALGQLLAADGADARKAYFYCCLVFIEHDLDPTPVIATGRWHGTIIDAPRGGHGFGYDPHFLVDGRDVTSAELEPAVKNAESHRGRAAARLVDLLSAGDG